MLSLEDLIARAEPDGKGRFLPVNLVEGSAKVSGSQGELEHIDAAISVASYNVNKATCSVHCVSCSETSYSGFFGDPDPISFAMGATQQATATGKTRSGGSYNVTSSVQWSSANTAIATVGTGSSSPGMATAVAPGSTTLTFESLPIQDQGQDCGDPPECPAAEVDDIDLPTQVQPVVTLTKFSDTIPTANGNVAGAINSFGFAATGSPTGGTFAWSSDSSNATLSATSGSSTTVMAASVGTANITVKYTVNGQSDSVVEDVNIVQPSALQIVSDTGTVQNVACSRACFINRFGLKLVTSA